MDIRHLLTTHGLEQYVRAFEALDITPADLPRLTEADLEELGVASLVHRRKILKLSASPSEQPGPGTESFTAGDDLQSLVTNHFPFPIAYGYRCIVSPDSASHAVDCVFYTYTALLRFVTITFLGQFLSSPGQNPKAAKAMQRLKNPTLESWFTVLSTLNKHLFALGPDLQLPYAPFKEGGPFLPALAAATRQLSSLRYADSPVHNQLRSLRNARAHGTPWDEAECARRLPHLLTLLDIVLENFAPLVDVHLLRRSPGGMIRLTGSAQPLPEEPITDHRLVELFDESETVLLGPEGSLLPLYPLFLAPDAPMPEGYTEPLLSFDGHGQKHVMYLGVRTWTARQDMLQRYHDLLLAKDIDPRFTKADLSPWSVTDWARESSRGVIENLRGIKYFPDAYQVRHSAQASRTTSDLSDEDHDKAELTIGVDDSVSKWIESGRQSALIVAAEAGAGKTSLFCRLTEQLLGDPDAPANDSVAINTRPMQTDCILLLLGGSIRGRTTLFTRIRDGLGFSDNPAAGGISRLDELLSAWTAAGEASDLDHDKRRILILIDAINEAEQPKALLEELADLAACAAAANHRADRNWVKLVVSFRAERLETLFARWSDTQDTPFLQHPENFATFEVTQGRRVPYLPLRRFSQIEAAAAYAKAQRSAASHCPANWRTLRPATHELLRHPLMLSLFHQAYANIEEPPALATTDTLWDAWLSRTFDAESGNARLERYALDLTDACIDCGHEQIPAEIVSDWREQWQAKLGDDPVRIAASLDPIERLTDAGLLRRTQDGEFDWVSDSLAEQVFFRALKQRDPEITEDSLVEWLALPVTSRLDSALSKAGVQLWHKDQQLVLRNVLDVSVGRARQILTAVLRDVAPVGRSESIEQSAASFTARLESLIDSCMGVDHMRRQKILLKCLLWDLRPQFEDRLGGTRGIQIILNSALIVARRLAELEPDNTSFLCDLSASYFNLGHLDVRRDPATARDRYERGLIITRRLTELEPDNTHFLRDLSLYYKRLGNLDVRNRPYKAKDWFEQGLTIARHLAELEPDNIIRQHDLAYSYFQLGTVHRLDPAKDLDWTEQGVTITRRLSELEPDNTTFLRDLSRAYNQLGKLEIRQPYRSDLEKRQNCAKARDRYEQGLTIARRLAELEPDKKSNLYVLWDFYNKLGNVEIRRDLARSLHWFEQGATIGRRLAKFDSDNTALLDDLASNYYNLGFYNHHLHAHAKARHWYEQGLDIRRRLAELEPDNTSNLYRLSTLYGVLGNLDGHRERAKARHWYEQQLTIRQRLAELRPDKILYLESLSGSYNKLGNLDVRRDPAKARYWYEQGLTIRQRVAKLQPDNTTSLCDLSFSYYQLGNLDVRRDPAKARYWFEQGLTITRRLAKLEPDNATLLRTLAASYVRLGELDGRPDPAKARDWFEQRLTTARRLAELKLENTMYLSNLSFSYSMLAKIDCQNSHNDARVQFLKAVETSRRRLTIDKSRQSKIELSQFLVQLGKTEVELNDPLANTRFEEALSLRQQVVQQNPDDAEAWGLVASSFSYLAEQSLNREGGDREQRLSEQAHTAMERAVKLQGDDKNMHYGLACALSRLNRTEEALMALTRSIELGFSDADWLAADPDLRQVRQLPAFEELLTTLRARNT